MTSIIQQLKAIVGEKYITTGDKALKWYVSEYRGRYQGAAMAAVRPKDTTQIAKIVKLCGAHNIPIVPQGGNTSLVGGSIPYDKDAVIINLTRLNKIRDIDPDNFSMTVGAGCVLADIQRTALEHDRYFPLSFGAEGSCQIGGNIATNAGGILTIGYGNTRDLILGLEVVLPNGDIWNGLRRLRKDNTGYDLKHLFIGAEGTLGIVTDAVLKLFPRPLRIETFFAGVESPAKAIALLNRCRAMAADGITAFELIPRLGLDLALEHAPGTIDPLAEAYPWYVLCNIKGGAKQVGLRDGIENVLGDALNDAVVGDATLADSELRRDQLWFIREAILEGQRQAGKSIKHDVSVPVSAVPEFLSRAISLVETMIPGVRTIPFGHLGDGNIHFNLTQPIDMNGEEFMNKWDDANHAVHDIVVELGGSIAAEHGIGTFKRDELATRKSSVEMAMMRSIKKALDPQNLFNPNVILKTDD